MSLQEQLTLVSASLRSVADSAVQYDRDLASLIEIIAARVGDIGVEYDPHGSVQAPTASGHGP